MSVGLRNLIAGCVGGAITSCLLVTPEVLKSRAQMTQHGHMSYGLELKNIIKNEGYRGLIRGLSGSMCRLPSSGIYMSSYEVLKEKFRSDHRQTLAS